MPELPELHEDPAALDAYNEKVFSRLARLEPTTLACVVTENYLFELFIWLASVRRAWTFHPWRAVAFSHEERTVERINALALPGLEARLLVVPGHEAGWAANAALKVALVEHGGLERALVSDLDNLFVAETPELALHLDANDLVFIGAPHSEWVIQTNLFGYRRTPGAIAFARRWIAESRGRLYSDASGLPFALRDHDDERLSVRVLAARRRDGAPHHACPYDVQTGVRPFELTRDLLGYTERHMGRAKVIHFGGIRSTARESVPARLEYLARAFPESWPVYPYYLECANEAASVLGLEAVADPQRFLSELAAREPTLRALVGDPGAAERAAEAARAAETARAEEAEAAGRGLREALAAADERVRTLEREMRSSRYLFSAAGRKLLGFPGAELGRLRDRLRRRRARAR